MPYRRRRRRRRTRRSLMARRRRYRRRRRTRKRGRFGKRQVVRRMPTALPDMVKMQMRYSFSLHITAAGIWEFTGNGLYDTFFTGAGHQPPYFQWLAEQYGRYYVYSGSFRMMMTPYQASDPVQITITPAPIRVGGAFPSNLTLQREFPRTKWLIVGPGSSTGVRTLRHFSTTKKVFGLGKNREDISGTPGSNPAEPWWWTIAVTAFSGTAAVNMHLDCELRFNTLWYDLNRYPPQDQVPTAIPVPLVAAGDEPFSPDASMPASIKISATSLAHV